MIWLSCSYQTERTGDRFAMTTLTQTLKRRQAVVKYSLRYGVTAASIRYNVSRPTIYKWRERYDGHLSSLKDLSRRPHSHANQHTDEELAMIQNYRRRNPNAGLVVLWVKLMSHGYTRSISGLYRVLQRTEQGRVKLPNPKYVPKEYEKMLYPGQRVQIDVKYVPSSCLVGAAIEDAKETGGYFQYTFIDEYSRFRYLEAFKEHSTFSSAEFIKHCVQKFPYAIECVQTENGPEFTNRLNAQNSTKPTLFEKTLAQLGIRHKLIKPYTPRHNGKVERSHRKDNEYFYASHKFYSFEDFQKQLAVWQRKYNDFPMRPLNWRSPKNILFSFPDCKA